jgi:hypothetical protein
MCQAAQETCEPEPRRRASEAGPCVSGTGGGHQLGTHVLRTTLIERAETDCSRMQARGESLPIWPGAWPVARGRTES